MKKRMNILIFMGLTILTSYYIYQVVFWYKTSDDGFSYVRTDKKYLSSKEIDQFIDKPESDKQYYFKYELKYNKMRGSFPGIFYTTTDTLETNIDYKIVR